MRAVRLVRMLITIGAAWLHGFLARPRTPAERGRWRALWAGRILRSLDIDMRIEGAPPVSGLVVSNHLSYVDVLTLGSVVPAIFVSKAEVRGWPVVGGVIHRGGTIFLKRGQARAAAEANRAIAQVLAEQVPVVIFPEGTTTGGDRVLPFHSALFEPAVRQGAPVWTASISYSFRNGAGAEGTVAYFGEDTLLPHLLRLAGRSDVVAWVRFSAMPVVARDRSAMAVAVREEVLMLLGGTALRGTALRGTALRGTALPGTDLQSRTVVPQQAPAA